MTTNKLLIGIIGLLLALNIGVLAFVFFQRPSHRGKDHGHGRRVEHFMQKRLDLSPEQTQDFDSLRKEHFKAVGVLAREIRKDRKALLRLMQSPLDSAAVNILLEEINTKNAQLEQLNFDHSLQLRRLCSPEQAEKFDHMMNRMLDRSSRWRGEHAKKPGDKH